MNTIDAFKSSESKSFRKQNPHLFEGSYTGPIPNLSGYHGGEDDEEHDHIAALTAKKRTKKRIRQSSAPIMNNLETSFYETIRYAFPNYPRPKPQAVKLRISRDAFFKPDFFTMSWPHEGGPTQPTAWEVKGLKGKNIDRGKLALKVAASAWPEIKFILVWKDEQSQWQEQHVLP